MEEEIIIESGSLRLPGTLTIPKNPAGLILLAHGSGSSRFSPRNQQVAAELQRNGLATLLFDLLTEDESEDRENVFDIPLLGRRLALATRWAIHQPTIQHLPLGYFGASTGAAAALWAAAEFGTLVRAVVSRGGRPDLAMNRLRSVTAPTLLIVGGDDEPVIEMNEHAHEQLEYAELLIIPGATHLFEEEGALEQVAYHAAQWFLGHLSPSTARHRAA
jgi:putative phosphoribosyl transferase